MKIKIELCLDISPHKYINFGHPEEGDKEFRVNVFYGGGRYFFFYSGIFKKRRLKRCTWILELILNRDKYMDKKEIRPLQILENVTKDGRYIYKEVYVSAYLMRRLLEQSDKPWTFDELEVYEN